MNTIGNLNSLGIGPSINFFNKSFSNSSYKDNIHKDFLNNVKQLKNRTKFNNSNSNFLHNKSHETNFNKENKESIINNINKDLPNSHLTKNINTNLSNNHPIRGINNEEIHSNINESSNTFSNVNWSNIFLTICKKKLFNYFKDLKFILNKNSYFHNKFICFIDETNTKFLIHNYKNSNIFTLRIMLNNMIDSQISNLDNINIKNSIDINKAIDLVKNLELMGPSNNLLICLDMNQIKLLQNKFQEGSTLYWPNGKDGITWLVKL